MAVRPFQPTNKAAEKRTQRVVMLFTESELVKIEREAKQRGETIHNLVRFALAALLRGK